MTTLIKMTMKLPNIILKAACHGGRQGPIEVVEAQWVGIPKTSQAGTVHPLHSSEQQQ